MPVPIPVSVRGKHVPHADLNGADLASAERRRVQGGEHFLLNLISRAHFTHNNIGTGRVGHGNSERARDLKCLPVEISYAYAWIDAGRSNMRLNATATAECAADTECHHTNAARVRCCVCE